MVMLVHFNEAADTLVFKFLYQSVMSLKLG